MTPRLYRLPEVIARTGMARSTVYARIKQGRFPAPIKLDDTDVSVWVGDLVDAWVFSQIEKAAARPGAATFAAA